MEYFDGTAATHRSNYLKHIEVSSILIVRRSLTESAHAESEDMQVLTPGKRSYLNKKKMNFKK